MKNKSAVAQAQGQVFVISNVHGRGERIHNSIYWPATPQKIAAQCGVQHGAFTTEKGASTSLTFALPIQRETNKIMIVNRS